MIGAVIRRVRCRRVHAWAGYELTPAEVELYRAPKMASGRWSRKTCRWCDDHGGEMPRRSTDRDRARLLDENAQTKLGINARLGPASRLLAPGYSWCGRCRTSWRFVEGHSTNYTEHRGCFPLCEACWSELTPEQRLPFYRDLWQSWQADGSDKEPDVWNQIESAVLAGK